MATGPTGALAPVNEPPANAPALTLGQDTEQWYVYDGATVAWWSVTVDEDTDLYLDAGASTIPNADLLTYAQVNLNLVPGVEVLDNPTSDDGTQSSALLRVAAGTTFTFYAFAVGVSADFSTIEPGATLRVRCRRATVTLDEGVGGPVAGSADAPTNGYRDLAPGDYSRGRLATYGYGWYRFTAGTWAGEDRYVYVDSGGDFGAFANLTMRATLAGSATVVRGGGFGSQRLLVRVTSGTVFTFTALGSDLNITTVLGDGTEWSDPEVTVEPYKSVRDPEVPGSVPAPYGSMPSFWMGAGGIYRQSAWARVLPLGFVRLDGYHEPGIWSSIADMATARSIGGDRLSYELGAAGWDQGSVEGGYNANSGYTDATYTPQTSFSYAEVQVIEQYAPASFQVPHWAPPDVSGDYPPGRYYVATDGTTREVIAGEVTRADRDPAALPDFASTSPNGLYTDSRTSVGGSAEWTTAPDEESLQENVVSDPTYSPMPDGWVDIPQDVIAGDQWLRFRVTADPPPPNPAPPAGPNGYGGDGGGLNWSVGHFAARQHRSAFLFNLTLRSPRWRVIVDPEILHGPYLEWTVEDTLAPPPPVRLYPRDDGHGLSTAPRLWPPTKARRLVGGHR